MRSLSIFFFLPLKKSLLGRKCPYLMVKVQSFQIVSVARPQKEKGPKGKRKISPDQTPRTLLAQFNLGFYPKTITCPTLCLADEMSISQLLHAVRFPEMNFASHQD